MVRLRASLVKTATTASARLSRGGTFAAGTGSPKVQDKES